MLSGSLPTPFSVTDIGSPAIAGSAVYIQSSNQYQVTAAGTGLGSVSGGTGDQASMVGENWTGAGSVTADIGPVADTGNAALAGVMVRDTAAGNSEFAAVGVLPAGQVVFDYRSSTGGAIVYESELTFSQPGSSTWVRLAESTSGGQENFTAYASQDGVCPFLSGKC
jgi:hypothetical protein